MLNYFWWYSISWALVLFLYSLNFADFSSGLDFGIVIFAIITSIISGVFGYVFRKEFSFFKEAKENKKESKIKENKQYNDFKSNFLFALPVVIVFFFSAIEFIIIRQVPFIEVVFLRDAFYQDVEFIPLYHVALIATATYLAVWYFYRVIVSKQRRKIAICCYVALMLLFLLYLMRSGIMIVGFISILMLSAYLLSKVGIKLKYALVTFAVIIAGLFGFGVFGNVRHGYDWNDHSFIEEIGLYDKWPAFIPRQLMWSYSYVTTPLANLNYNTNNVYSDDFNIVGIISELLPDTISKRIVSEKVKVDLVKSYFTASTGYARSYIYGGYFGLYFMFMFLMGIGVLGIFIKKAYRSEPFIIFSGFLSATYLLMTFDNMLAYVGLSIPLWVSFFVLVFSSKRKAKK